MRYIIFVVKCGKELLNISCFLEKGNAGETSETREGGKRKLVGRRDAPLLTRMPSGTGGLGGHGIDWPWPLLLLASSSNCANNFER